MEKRISNRTMGKLVAAAAVGLAGFGAAQHADASLIVDVRATALNGNPLTAGNTAKSVTVATGDVVTLKLFAQISGTNGVNDEGIQSAQGNMVSSGALLGTMTSLGATGPNFNQSGTQNGSQQDLDGDTDLDIGAPLGSTATAATGYFAARNASGSVGGTTDLSAQSEEVEIGTMTFTVGSGGTETFVNFVRRASATNGNQTTAGTWFEDGVSKNAASSSFTSGSPVQVTTGIPEPTGLALAGLASLGLLGRRRNKNA